METGLPPFVANGIVTLTTDFGTADAYVGAMKGRILSDFPGARIVDISHAIAPGDLQAGAFVMEQACRYFPPDTVHLGVVDPGVGSARAALIIDCDLGQLGGRQRFVGPDNGLLTEAAALRAWSGDEVWQAWRIDRIPDAWTIAPTFHGRDLFARVAAALARGASIADFSGQRVPEPVRLPSLSEVTFAAGSREGAAVLSGRVIHVDRFGNLVSSIGFGPFRSDAGDGRWVVEVAGQTVPVARTYADVAPGELLAYLGSAMRIEVAVRDGSAAARLGVGVGEPVTLRQLPAAP